MTNLHSVVAREDEVEAMWFQAGLGEALMVFMEMRRQIKVKCKAHWRG